MINQIVTLKRIQIESIHPDLYRQALQFDSIAVAKNFN